MSKYVKNLMMDHIRDCLVGVDDALLVNMIGLDANANNQLRAELESKDIQVLVVKNSMAARATADTPLGAMFNGIDGNSAICWGSEDIVSLAKEVVRLAGDAGYKAFEARGGVLDGEQLTAEEVKAVSKWPSRQEQLSLLVGQLLGPGSKLSGQLIGPGGALASQIAQLGDEETAQDVAQETAA